MHTKKQDSDIFLFSFSVHIYASPKIHPKKLCYTIHKLLLMTHEVLGINHRCLLTLMQQLLSVGGLFALRLKESIDALPDQILPARPARCSQSARFYGDDLPWSGTHMSTLLRTAQRF